MQKVSLLIYCSIIILSGCSTFTQYSKLSKQINDEHGQSNKLVQELQTKHRPYFVVHDEMWVSKKAIKATNNRLPSHMNYEITFATGAPMTLNDFSKLINKLCGLSIRVTPDAEAKIANISLNGKKDRNSTTNSNNTNNSTINGIRWQGRLEGLLDIVVASLGLSWKYSNGVINLYYLDSRTFQIFAIPSETEMTSIVQSGIDAGITGSGNSGGGGKGSGQSSQSTLVSLKSAMVKDIRSSVESMLTPGIGRLSASSATGTITVTDTPEVLNSIQTYIDSENSSITKQVLLNVKILAVTLNNTDQFNINWNLVYNTKKIGSLISTKSMDMADIGSSATINILDGNFKDTNLLVEALAKQGKVSVITSPSVTTLNLQPVPIQVATQTSYLARVEIKNDSSTNKDSSSVSLTPGNVTSGFNMNLLPFVMPNNQLLLQYSINLSELKQIKTIVGDKSGNKIQLPEIDNRIFSQKVKLKSEQTLVLSGFEQTSNNGERKGTGDATNWLFGGGVKAEHKRTVIVIMITPVVLE